jgi:hypothetical protein
MSNYFRLAYQFLNLSTEAIVEMEAQGNQTGIWSEVFDSEEESDENYHRMTRWNDFNIGVPVLFNFYHGLELLMKGLLYLNPDQKPIKTHKLTELLNQLKTAGIQYPAGLINILEKHLSNQSPFNPFFVENSGNIDDFCHFLKYPESGEKSGRVQFRFGEINGTKKVGLKRFEEVRRDIKLLRQEIITWNEKKTKAQHQP